MAKIFGYEQVTGIFYTKEQDGWYEVFYLQASSWGIPFFYFNYGVILPKIFPSPQEQLRQQGWLLAHRLPGNFSCATKADIDESAQYAVQAYQKEAVPWFKSLTIRRIRDEASRQSA